MELKTHKIVREYFHWLFILLLLFCLSSNISAQISIPFNKSVEIESPIQDFGSTTIMDSLNVFPREKLQLVSGQLPIGGVLGLDALTSVIDSLNNLPEEMVEAKLDEIGERRLSNARESFSDPFFLDIIFDIGYQKFMGKFNEKSAEHIKIKRDFERTLSILFQNRVYLNSLSRESESVKNEVEFRRNESLSLLYEREKIKDEKFVKKIELLDDRREMALFFYNRTRNHKWFYFPILDWRKEMPKAKLTELFFTNQFSEENLNALSGSLLNIDFDNAASLYTELLSSFVGPGKVALTTQVSSAPQPMDSIPLGQDAAIQRLIGGGGNLGLTYQVPLLSAHVGKNVQWGSIFQPRIGFDVPELSSTLDTATVQWEVANQGFLNLYTSSDALSFFFGYKLAVVGGNMNYENIIDQETFNYNQISIGITINETFRIIYNDFFGSQFVQDNFPTNTISLVLVPR